jgi:nucleoside-diphosphate-sugar epimerase
VALVRRESDTSSLGNHPNLDVVRLAIKPGTSIIPSWGKASNSSMIHCAWSGVAGNRRNDLGQLDNIALTLDLLDLAKSSGISNFVGVGSQAEYGPKAGRISEDEPLKPTHLYGYSKAAAFLAAQGAAQVQNIQFSWARIFSVYGPNDAPHWLIPKVIDTIRQGKSLSLTKGEQLWDYLYVEDAAEALIALADLPEGIGAVNLGHGQTHRVRAVVEKIRAAMSPDYPLIFGAEDYRHDQVMHLEADITKLHESTGWTPKTTLEDGLSKTILSRTSGGSAENG